MRTISIIINYFAFEICIFSKFSSIKSLLKSCSSVPNFPKVAKIQFQMKDFEMLGDSEASSVTLRTNRRTNPHWFFARTCRRHCRLPNKERTRTAPLHNATPYEQQHGRPLNDSCCTRYAYLLTIPGFRRAPVSAMNSRSRGRSRRLFFTVSS